MEKLKEKTKSSKSALVPNAIGNAQIKSFREDTSLLLKINHPNILRMFAEMERASKIQILRTFLKSSEEKENLQEYLLTQRTTENQLVSWCHDICKGMEFLHSRNVMHRGLTIRCVILSKDTKTVKISYSQTAVQVVRRGAVVSYSSTGFPEVIPTLDLSRRKLNLHHSARECLLEGKFTTASDVWAFGMTMLEIFNAGLSPYRGMKRKRADALIKEGISPVSFVKLEVSHEISQRVIKPALRVHPELRHSFSTLCETFDELKRRDFPNEFPSGMEKLGAQRTPANKINSNEDSLQLVHYPLGRNFMYWRTMLTYFMQKQLLLS